MNLKKVKKLNKDVYESVCSLLNRYGGHLFLGVKDNGDIVGVDKDSVQQLKKDFVTSLNNTQTLNPTYYLTVDDVEVEGKTILYIYIPESSQAHRCKGKIFDRNEDGDFDITNNSNLVSGLYLRDPNTGKQGITLGGILIFGKEELIHAALPHHRTDAILRVENFDRYDDRDDIRVNLLRSYERLMQFIAKHLNDKFYLEGDQRVSLRDKIFREAITNLLIHREFSNPFPAKLVIEQNRVYIENSNKAHGNGILNPLIKGDLLKLTMPDKSTSPKQKYYSNR